MDHKTELTHLRPIYLPYWSVDAGASMKSNSALHSAQARFIVDHLQLPAHDQADLQALRFAIPSPSEAAYTAFREQVHLDPETRDGRHGNIVPFTLSPLLLPGAAIISDALKEPIPSLETTHLKSQGDFERALEQIYTGRASSAGRIGRESIKFDIISLEMDYLTCSPVLLPFYIATFATTSSKVNPLGRGLTLALPAWKGSRQWAFRRHPVPEESAEYVAPTGDWEYNVHAPLTSFKLTFHPKPPTTSTLEDDAEVVNIQEEADLDEVFKQAEAKAKAEGKTRDYEQWDLLTEEVKGMKTSIRKKASDQLADLAEKEISRNYVAASYLSSMIAKEVEKVYTSASFWATLRRFTILDYKSNRKAQPTKDAEPLAISPEESAGLGGCIPWEHEQITSFCSDEYKVNKGYLNGLLDYQSEKQALITRERTLDEDQYLTYGKVASTSGQLLIKKKQDIIKVAPSWLNTYMKRERGQMETWRRYKQPCEPEVEVVVELSDEEKRRIKRQQARRENQKKKLEQEEADKRRREVEAAAAKQELERKRLIKAERKAQRIAIIMRKKGK
ncbi:hypothetical protein CBS101457_006211 [Exobasidium rhododendri]|nr:hypothetical protein CBS101457_006211 [Exobasidium rhododendri]